MAEYIEREYVLKCMEDSYKNAGISAEAKAKMTRWLNKAPAADVRPVARGFNVDKDYPSLFECSVCGWSDGDTTTGDTRTYNFCPNCGADMR